MSCFIIVCEFHFRLHSRIHQVMRNAWRKTQRVLYNYVIMKTEIPIIFIHKGNSPYLKFALAQAQFSNPHSDIILIGDNSNQHYSETYKHWLIHDYSLSATEFSSRYLHLSTNNYDFELFCFQRWFILYDFIVAQEIKAPFVYLDSDVLIMTNVREQVDLFMTFSMTVSRDVGPQYSFFRSASVLKELCNLMISFYMDKNLSEGLKGKYLTYFTNLKKPGGICDMTLINEYRMLNKDLVIDLCQIINNETYDHNLNLSDGFLMKGCFKKLTRMNNRVMGQLASTKEKVFFKGLHFQGAAKLIMHRYSLGLTPSLFERIWLELKYFYFQIKHFVRRAENQLPA